VRKFSYLDLTDPEQSLALGHKVTFTLSFLVAGLKHRDDLTYGTETLLGI